MRKKKPIPTFNEELILWGRGMKLIAGVDEAGCGCWAGPLVSAAVILNPNFQDPGVMDSKLLTSLKRERFRDIIIKQASDYGIGEASEAEIDHFGLSKAKALAMVRALTGLRKKPEFVLIDGYAINLTPSYKYKAIIKGDQKVKSIACASILAKVHRDNLIKKLSVKYPEYHFDKNKGYGTSEHIKALLEFGVCSIHRRSYKPIKKILKQK